MSNSLAIAAVTASLRRMLLDELAGDPLFSGFTVSSKALSQAAEDAGSRLNVFLYEVVPSPYMRNLDVAGDAGPGERGRPPLSLGLRYLITAFGEDHDEVAAHRLLGRALASLHDHPVLSRSLIRSALPQANLHRQVEEVRITQIPMSVDEMSKLWTTFEAGYRASVAYEASVVLIETETPAIAGLPVLTVGVDDAGVEVVPDARPARLGPAVDRAVSAGGEVTVELGETLALEGAGLDGATAVHVVDVARTVEHELTPGGASGADRVEVTIPAGGVTAGRRWIAGLHMAQVVVADGSEVAQTNQVPFALGPRIASIGPANAAQGDVTYTVSAAPRVAPQQRASLMLGDREVRAEPRDAASDPLVFEAADMLPGTYPVRLRVDGVDSRLVDRSTTPPSYLAGRSVDVA